MSNQIKVTRFQLKDKASSYNRTIWQKLFTALILLRYKNIFIGKNTIISLTCEFTLTDNATIKFGSNCTIKKGAYFILTKPSPKIIIGDFVGIGRDCYFSIKSTLSIGNYSRIGPRVTIIDQDHSFLKSDLIMNQQANISPITIGEDVWIGNGVTILKGVNIGRGSVVAAGAVVTENIPDYEIWGGVPAKFIKARN